ncbi:COPII coat assembly protein SEC16 [Seiridium cupressi]
MASDTLNASWHPAFMPNSHAEGSVRHQIPEHEPQQPEDESTTEQAQSQDIQETSSHEIPDEATAIESTNPNQGAFLDQFEDDDPEAAGWDLGNAEANLPSAPRDDQALDAEPAAVEEATAYAPESASQSKAAKHSSTVSFARTAQEVNWNDDEDAEWNLQRSETDPFKFMAASERTNSFPAVPPVETNEEEFLDQQSPPPATQAQEIMQELEQGEAQQHDLTPQPDFLKSFDDEDSSFPVGGDMVGADEAADGARFEEGLPLIPHDDHENIGNVEAPSSYVLEPSFADETGGDDFFSQIQGGEKQEAEEFDVNPSLQRKDTSVFTTLSTGANAFEPETPTVAENDEFEPVPPTVEAGESTSENALSTDVAPGEQKAEESNEADAKWAAAFDEDDDFLLEDSATEDKELDPAAFFGSDDEGFLEDDVDDASTPALSQPVQQTPTQAPNPATSSRYTPAAVPAQAQPLLNTFNSTPDRPQVQHAYAPQYAPTGAVSTTPYGAPLQPKPEASRAQSFAAKSKGGYASPYDLPMDVVRAPRQRSSMQQLPRTTLAPSAPPAAPVRSTSMYAQLSPAAGAPSSMPSPPSSSGSNQPAPNLKPAPKLSSKSSFFEDLPITSKPRSASRQNSLPSPQHPHGQPPHAPPPGPPSGSLQGSPMPHLPTQSPSSVAGLVAPERQSPYAPLQSSPQHSGAPATNRYSPAPSQGSAAGSMAPPVASTSRYSPAPPSRSNSATYPHVPPPVLAHQPRTSSPLAQFEKSNEFAQNKNATSPGQGPSLSRNFSSQHEPRLTRVPSLPPTREVEEDGLASMMQSPPPMAAASRYSPQRTRRTPPPTASPATSTLSPPKRPASNYAPVSHSAIPTREVSFAPPPRSQTQSPGALHGRAPLRSTDAIPRPSSAQGPTSPRQVSSAQPHPPVTRTRGMSQVLNLVPPTDGRELDPLQRWRGAPSISWGLGGAIVTSFPKDVPRYGMSQALPMILRSPGEVKVQHIKDVQPIEERLAKFPGPLKGKSKKKEIVAWLTQGIDFLEKELPNVAFQQYVVHEDKRAIERVLLWKILRVFIENDGALEGNPNVEKAVRQVLSPELDTSSDEPSSPVVTMADLQGASSGIGGLRTDAVDSSTIEQIRKNLLNGDREKAAWAAVDKRLWGHAMLISSTVPGDLYRQVTQEFIKKEVNQVGGSNESLAALYGVLSGNHEESVDALVPSHARAGLQLMSTSIAPGQSTDTLAGLDKWQETLGLILSNRSNNDVVAITSLGNLLSSYGRAEAAHICFLFARKHAVFGGLDDPNANFVLVGADHRRQADQFAKETEALLMSEVYEFGLALSGSATQQSCPHLAAYKLQHAMTLAEYGSRDKALAYCEAINYAITAQTKRSPYYHPILMTGVDDLMSRLKLSPKEGGSSWISKPTTSSMWDKFNKFVSGDDAQNSGQGSPGEPGAESGPFARIGGGTPTISRSPSVNNFETFGGHSPALTANQTLSRYAPNSGQRTASYDPSSNYATRTSMERSSGEYHRGSLELPRPSQESVSSMYGGPSVESTSTAAFGYQPVSAAPTQSQYAPAQPAVSQSAYQPAIAQEHSTSSYSPYQPAPAQETSAASTSPYQPTATGAPSLSAGPSLADTKPEIAVNDVPTTNGFQPISYGGYQPPTGDAFDNSSVSPVDAVDDDQGQASGEATSGSGWEAPSYQPYSFEPPTDSYEPDPEDGQADSEQLKPKKKSFMDDDDDTFPSMRSASPASAGDKSKSEKDRENEEMFRKVAEEEAKRAAEAKSQKKGGWLGGWFGGGAKKESEIPGNKPIRAKLGETSSFVYDPDQKRWVNKKGGAEETTAKSATPPPPRAASRNGTPPPPGSSSAPPMSTGTPPPMANGPPMGMPRSVSNLSKMASMDNLTPPGPALGGTPPMARSVSNMSNLSNVSAESNGPPTLARPNIPSAPPSRPSTSLSNASSIDDLLGAAGPRKAGGKKPRKGGRYIDVMAK